MLDWKHLHDSFECLWSKYRTRIQSRDRDTCLATSHESPKVFGEGERGRESLFAERYSESGRVNGDAAGPEFNPAGVGPTRRGLIKTPDPFFRPHATVGRVQARGAAPRTSVSVDVRPKAGHSRLNALLCD